MTRLFLTVLLTLLLAACATQQGPQAAGDALGAGATAANEVDPTLRKMSADQTIDLDHGSVASLAQGQGDLWSRIRSGFQLPDLNDPLVQTQLNWYLARPDYVQRMTDRSQKYLYHIVAELNARHMPTELALLPFIESAYNPQALSVAKAAGMWQFVPGTGRDYNLKQNMFQDQRRDVLASTNAALDHLSHLHDMFGDWFLALAAYNWGEGNVQRAIARNQAAGLPTDYESLKLPDETRNYVPKLQAVKDLIAHPELYGLTLPPIPNRPYFVTVKTSHDIDVDVAARLAGMTVDEFKALNPSFRQPLIVGSSGSPILLPFDNAQTFETNLKSYDGPLSSWTTYTVTTRERLDELAHRLGVEASVLMSVNKIPAGMRLRSGSTILVPKTANSEEDISADVVENAVLSIEPDLPDTHKVFVRVKRTESVAQLALRYGVSIAQVQSWNRTRRTSFKPGQMVLLHLPVGKPMPGEAAPHPLEATHAEPAHPEPDQGPRGGIIKVSDPVRAPAPVPSSHKSSRTEVVHETRSGGPAPAATVAKRGHTETETRAPVKVAAVRGTAKPTEKLAAKPVEKFAAKPAGKPTEKPTEKPRSVAAKTLAHAAPKSAHSTVGKVAAETRKPLASADKIHGRDNT